MLGDYFGDKLQVNRLLAVTPEGINAYFRVYLEGWKSGVEQFWNEIRDRL